MININIPILIIKFMAVACIIAGILSIPNPYLGFMCPPLNDSLVCTVKSNLHLEELNTFLTLLGLVGLYFTTAKQTRLLGLISFLVTFAGSVLQAGSTWMREFLYPVLQDIAPDLLAAGYPPALKLIIQIGFDMSILGWFLFAIASIRGNAFPKKAAWMMMAGIILGRFVPMGFLLGEPLYGVALILMGRTVWLLSITKDENKPANLTF
jgi:hypothetical protein